MSYWSKLTMLRSTSPAVSSGEVRGLLSRTAAGSLRDTNMAAVKVAEHSFQEPMPNSTQLLNYLCFGARFLQESRLITEVFILAFLQGCMLLPWQRGWFKTWLK